MEAPTIDPIRAGIRAATREMQLGAGVLERMAAVQIEASFRAHAASVIGQHVLAQKAAAMTKAGDGPLALSKRLDLSSVSRIAMRRDWAGKSLFELARDEQAAKAIRAAGETHPTVQ